MRALKSGSKKQAAKKCTGTESIDFDMPESEQYVNYVVDCRKKKLGRYKGAFRWLYLCLVGIGAGASAVFIQTSLHRIMALKFWTQDVLADAGHDVWTRYFAWLLLSLGLVSVAGALVCYVEPLAAGSGIPEIKCYLNGIKQPNVLRWKTLIAKAGGIVFSVAAGLPCGKEGPMIHSGAIVGAQAAKANAGPLVSPFRKNHEARDFVAAGAAAGVAAAFGAPIGGVLFAVEEGASHMNPIILVRSFVCASFATLTVRFFTAPLEHGIAWGTLGTEVPVEFGRFPSTSRRYFVWELFVVFAAIGVAGGLLGAIANGLNTQLTKWRMRHVGPRGHYRFLEVLLLTAVIVSFNFWAPLLQGGSLEMGSFTDVQRLFVEAGGTGMEKLLHSEENFEPRMLLFFAVAHYVQLIWTYGLGVPSGLFVPALLGGASFGRLIGQALQGSPYIGATPGIYALIGATAMLAGMGRITISLAVILMETTGEAEWGLPIFLTVMFAKWTGDLVNKGIYDIHIELKHVPLLEGKPEKQMIVLQACDFMTPDVVTLDVVGTVGAVLEVLENCSHHGFPVIDPESQHYLGLVDRSTLHHLLHLGGQAGVFTEEIASAGTRTAKASGRLVGYEDMLRQHHPTIFPSIEDVKAALSEQDLDMFVDLRPYTNLGCFTVPEHASAMRCFSLFRSLGLRHLPVIGKDHEVSGIITRQNLLAAQEGHLEEGMTPTVFIQSKWDKQTPLLDADPERQIDVQIET